MDLQNDQIIFINNSVMQRQDGQIQGISGEVVSQNSKI